MNKTFLYISAIVFFTGCKLQGDTNREYDKYDPSKTYKLRVNPMPGSNYHYEITNETEMSLDVDGKKIENVNKSDIGINYKIDKDTANNFLFTLQFYKIHLYSKNNDKIKEIDASNGTLSIDPVEKMLAILKETTLQSIVSPAGESKVITGFKEIGDKIMAAFPATDPNAKFAIEMEWNKTIGENLVKKNTDQLFNFFPDSTVHLGDSWKLASKQEGEIDYVVKNVFTLKAINNDIAIIESHGIITTENATSNYTGLGNNSIANLSGEQEGEYQMETKTGMLINCRIKANINGTIQVMGREIPIKIKSSVNITGRKGVTPAI